MRKFLKNGNHLIHESSLRPKLRYGYELEKQRKEIPMRFAYRMALLRALLLAGYITKEEFNALRK